MFLISLGLFQRLLELVSQLLVALLHSGKRSGVTIFNAALDSGGGVGEWCFRLGCASFHRSPNGHPD
jgi:hypothetical protein